MRTVFPCWRRRNEHPGQPHGTGASGHAEQARTENGGHATRDGERDHTGSTIPTRADPALARDFRYQRLLDEGQCGSISEMAEVEKLDRGYMGRLLQLTLLAPGTVEAMLNDNQSDRPGLPDFLERLPFAWKAQRDRCWNCLSMQ